jgi:hypothetical protein
MDSIIPCLRLLSSWGNAGLTPVLRAVAVLGLGLLLLQRLSLSVQRAGKGFENLPHFDCKGCNDL